MDRGDSDGGHLLHCASQFLGKIAVRILCVAPNHDDDTLSLRNGVVVANSPRQIEYDFGLATSINSFFVFSTYFYLSLGTG